MSIRKTIDTFLSKLEKEYTTYNRIEVSQSALIHNLTLFTHLTRQAAIPVLKGNAYGNGIALVATVLKEQRIPYVAVDGYFEALRIREVSKQPVLIMGAVRSENYPRLKYDGFAFVVQDAASIHALGKTGKRVPVHLEVNTGMNRSGARPDELASLTKLILNYPNLQLEGVMSHLADSDGDNPATVDTAVALYDSCVETVLAVGAHPTLFHVAQSAGSVVAKSRYANAFRPGVGLYGGNPFPPHHPHHRDFTDLRPTLKLVSTITKTISLRKGDKVGYNYNFTAPEAMRIGVLPLGYYEGVSRALSNVGFVKVGTASVPIVGRVCMNHTMINLNDTSACEGDEVVVYSNAPADLNTIENIAHDYDLFYYTLLTGLNQDVRRILVA